MGLLSVLTYSMMLQERWVWACGCVLLWLCVGWCWVVEWVDVGGWVGVHMWRCVCVCGGGGGGGGRACGRRRRQASWPSCSAVRSKGRPPPCHTASPGIEQEAVVEQQLAQRRVVHQVGRTEADQVGERDAAGGIQPGARAQHLPAHVAIGRHKCGVSDCMWVQAKDGRWVVGQAGVMAGAGLLVGQAIHLGANPVALPTGVRSNLVARVVEVANQITARASGSREEGEGHAVCVCSGGREGGAQRQQKKRESGR